MKILRYLIVMFSLYSFLNASDAVVANDKEYFKFKENNVEIIYTEDNIPFARHTASVENPLNKDYEYFFDWKLDETLYVCLISNHNQIANGFSTQWPNNRQVNYVGGTQLIDTFSSTSWLDTLLYHETAHNYQVNVKGSGVSRSLHSVFGNGFIFPFIPLAVHIVPNAAENSFMLEGNAVLNESWHGNGGRLYNGRFKAQTILQAKAGKIKAAYVYNSKLAFPYGDIFYIQGGYYNLYLAQKYGMKRLNRYFKYYSKHFMIPLYTNESMLYAIGMDFEDSLDEFARVYADKAKDLVLASGEHLASSQFFNSLSNDDKEIFFLTNESGVRAPELNVIDKTTFKISKKRDSWLYGKVIKNNGIYYTQGSYYTSPSRIYQGLFDSKAIIKEGTKSKMVQGYLSDGKKVYFDVASSYSEPKLYVEDVYYAKVNSSVVIDKEDNLYYFVQEGKKRILYKNKRALYVYEGFYGIVSDVDTQGNVYFVANSENGSTLYMHKDKKVTRVSDADNIVEARLINDKEVLLAAISEKDYYYVKNKLVNIDEEPYATKLFFEDKAYYGKYKESKTAQKDYAHMDLSNSYKPLLDMYYSGTNLSLLYIGNVIGDMNINFSDPLTQNSAFVFASKDEDNTTIYGVSYSNSQYLFQYSFLGYKVDNSGTLTNARDAGMVLNLALPFYKEGRYSAIASSSYYQDYGNKDRDPINTKITFSESQAYGVSMYYNYLNSLSIYGSYEADNKVYGAKYSYKHDLPYEFYFGLNAKYSKSNSITKGVTLANTSNGSDYSTIGMPSVEYKYYIKRGGYVDISLAKVINLSSYWFTFPISMQRESIYAKYRYYEIQSKSDKRYSINETTAGITFATVFFNKAVVPISVEHIYNDAEFIKNRKKTIIKIDVSF